MPRYGEVRRRYIERRLPPHPEDAAAWAEFCRTIEARIETARAEEPRLCPSCEAVRSTKSRRCTICRDIKPLRGFVRDRGKPLGYGYRCKDCKSRENAAERRLRKFKIARAIVRRAS